MRPKVLCAIYTRKSSEEGLDQAFNSLDAQREAGESFICSQQHEGWAIVPTRYDDGGLSGATMERPALKRLLADIEAGKIGIVVVYKVDRLTRALSDFAKMIEVFDHHRVSFVSVTQQFNTTTSMGRLTLNVLLSFAQFEREVTGERIRDKIAASKKKGMWMGGRPPLGYDVVNRMLVVNPEEAEAVRWIFRRYLDLGAINRLRADVVRQGIKGKIYTSAAGRRTGGGPFGRSALHRLLGNHLYIGEVAHRGQVYEGEHEAIVERDLWDQVQAKIEQQRRFEGVPDKAREVSLLKGLIFDSAGGPLTPVHATKRGKRYRYYISNHIISGQIGSTADRRIRVPAHEIEQLAIVEVRRLIRDRTHMFDILKAEDASLATTSQAYRHLASLADSWDNLVHHDQRCWLKHLLSRVEVADDHIEVQVNTKSIAEAGRHGMDALVHNSVDQHEPSQPFVLTIAAHLMRRGRELRIVLGNTDTRPCQPDPELIAVVARAHHWLDQLMSGDVTAIRDIACNTQDRERHVGQILRLAFLAPDIVEAILEGRQPPTLTAGQLIRADPPLDWNEQRRLLGFSLRNSAVPATSTR